MTPTQRMRFTTCRRCTFLLILTLFMLPRILAAQCGFVGIVNCPAPYICTALVADLGSHSTTYVPPGNCALTASMNAMCSSSALTTMTFVSPSTFLWSRSIHLYGMGTAPSPSCAWNCCGDVAAVTMTSTDGLPVELMDFSVESGDTWATEDEEGESESADEDRSD